MLYRLLCASLNGPFSSSVISLTDIGPVGQKIQDIGIPVIALGMRRGFPDPRKFVRLVCLLRQLKPQLVQTWMYHADLLGGLAAKAAGDIPIIWSIHHTTLDTRLDKKNTILVANVCARLSKWLPKKIVCCSKTTKKIHISLGYSKQKMVVIPNGFDLKSFHPDNTARKDLRSELCIPEDAALIGLVGRFHPQKDHRNFVKAAEKLNRSYPNVHFLLCGNNITWDNSDLVAWIDTAGIRGQCHLLGPRDDMPTIQGSLDILASSSRGEAFPLVIGEAMACGVPCVATNVGDSAYIVGDTGIIVPPRDPHALAQAWEKLLSLSLEERIQLGNKARKRIMDNFDLQSVAKKYEDLWMSVIRS